MNVLADFIVRVEEQYPLSIENEELNSLLTTIRNQADEIESLNKELNSMRKNVEQYNIEHRRDEAAEAAPAPKARKPRSCKAKAAEAPADKAKPGRKPRAKKAE